MRLGIELYKPKNTVQIYVMLSEGVTDDIYESMHERLGPDLFMVVFMVSPDYLHDLQESIYFYTLIR